MLLPTSSNKLLAQWQGPYPVRKQVTPVTYQIDMTDKRKRNHVNMLRKWNTPTGLNLWSDEDQSEVEEAEIPTWKDEGKEPIVNSCLTSRQQQDILNLCEEFADVLSEKPGRTKLAEHKIVIGETPAVRLPPYRLQDEVKR